MKSWVKQLSFLKIQSRWRKSSIFQEWTQPTKKMLLQKNPNLVIELAKLLISKPDRGVIILRWKPSMTNQIGWWFLILSTTATKNLMTKWKDPKPLKIWHRLNQKKGKVQKFDQVLRNKEIFGIKCREKPFMVGKTNHSTFLNTKSSMKLEKISRLIRIWSILSMQNRTNERLPKKVNQKIFNWFLKGSTKKPKVLKWTKSNISLTDSQGSPKIRQFSKKRKFTMAKT